MAVQKLSSLLRVPSMTKNWLSKAHNLYTSIGQRTKVVLFIVTLVVLFYPDIRSQLSHAFLPHVFEDDVAQHIWPLWRYYDRNLFADDYIADYFLALMPAGYKYVFSAVGSFLDPQVISKLAAYLLFLALLTVTGVTAWRLHGNAVAFAAVALIISADIFLDRIAGGLPRAFGFPLTALIAYALVSNRVYLLGATTVIAALFYPPIAVLAGCAFAMVLFLPDPLASRLGISRPPSLKKRAVILTVFGMVTAASVVPTVSDLNHYGARVAANNPVHVERFPERLGRHPLMIDRLVSHKGLLRGIEHYSWATFVGNGPRFIPGKRRQVHQRRILISLIAMTGIGYLGLAWRDATARRLLVLPAAMLVTSIVAIWLNPHLYYPQRYVMYAVPAFLVIAFPAGLAGLVDAVSWLRSVPGSGPGLVIIGTAIMVVGLGGRGSLDKGLRVVPERFLPLYSFLQSLPSDALIAGWPTGPIDEVPYLARKRILLSRETQLAFHEAYILELRARMNALIDAYFAPESGPLVALHRHFGVTHLIVDAQHFDANTPPTYFAPFQAQVDRIVLSASGLETAAVLTQQAARVFDKNGWMVLDLRNLTRSHQ